MASVACISDHKQVIENGRQLFCQGTVIEFLVKEEIPTANIHHRLQRVYGDVCMGASSVR